MECRCRLSYRADGAVRSVSVSEQNGEITVRVEDDGQRRRVTVTADRTVELLDYIETDHDFFFTPPGAGRSHADDLYFINGYQSWTDTKEFSSREKEKDVLRLPRKLIDAYGFDLYGDATFYKYDKKVLHSYDLFYVKGSREGLIVSLNSENAFLITQVERKSGKVRLKSDIKGTVLEKGQSYTVCDYMYKGPKSGWQEALDSYYPKKPIKKIFGYTSWYNYYQDINEEIIRRDLDALDSRFNLFQIDDGYETFVGDWLEVDPVKFPNGMEPLVDAIHQKGLMAGIWLAPFVAEEKSRLFRERPDLFKKGPDGKPVRCGSNWSGFYALDLDNRDAKEYISRCLGHYAQMGFDFFKLDFLYAASLPEYRSKTRCRAAGEAYEFLRRSLGDKLILGCGATLINSAGRFDYLRVGPDVSLKFDDVCYMRFMHRERISTKVTLQNTVYRSFIDCRFFGNDPDVFLLRDSNISLSAGQREALITLNALFGSVMMTSDNIATYDDGMRSLLAQKLELFQNAKVTGYRRDSSRIVVDYTLDGKQLTLTYDTERGVLI